MVEGVHQDPSAHSDRSKGGPERQGEAGPAAKKKEKGRERQTPGVVSESVKLLATSIPDCIVQNARCKVQSGNNMMLMQAPKFCIFQVAFCISRLLKKSDVSKNAP